MGTDLYTLGKGKLYFDKLVNDEYFGYRDLGNASEVNLTIDISKLDHYSSRGGLRVKDLSIVSEVNPAATMVLDEISVENLSLMSMATTTTETQDFALVTTETHKAYKGRKIDLDNRNVLRSITESHLVLTGAPTSAATVGQTVVGDTSGATAIVIAALGGTTYDVYNVTGTFQASETLTAVGGTSGEAGTLDATDFFTTDTTATSQTLTVTGATAGLLVENTDWKIVTADKDLETGRIEIMDGASIDEGEVLTFVYTAGYDTYEKVNGLNETYIEGRLQFISDNPVGNNYKLDIWRASVSPNGDIAFIGEDWATLPITAEILKDEDSHPNEPYFRITKLD